MMGDMKMETMEDFQKAIQMAAELKQCQPDMQRKAKRWERTPKFVQNTLISDKLPAFQIRHSSVPLSERLAAAEKMKAQADEVYQKAIQMLSEQEPEQTSSTQDAARNLLQERGAAPVGSGAASALQRAVEMYSMAAGIFRYCEKYRDDDGDAIREVDNLSSLRATAAAFPDRVSPLEADRALSVVLRCYANLAQCYLRLRDFHGCISACEEVLKLDESHVKALYRCALANYRVDELEEAIRHCKRAVACSGADNKDLPLMKAQLMQMRQEQKAQIEKDKKTFTGMFDRGNMYDDVAASGDDGAGLGTTDHIEQAAAGDVQTGKKSLLEQEFGDLTAEDMEISETELEFLQPFVVAQRKAQEKLKPELKDKPFHPLEMRLAMIRAKLSARKFGLNIKDKTVQEELMRAHELGPDEFRKEFEGTEDNRGAKLETKQAQRGYGWWIGRFVLLWLTFNLIRNVLRITGALEKLGLVPTGNRTVGGHASSGVGQGSGGSAQFDTDDDFFLPADDEL